MIIRKWSTLFQLVGCQIPLMMQAAIFVRRLLDVFSFNPVCACLSCWQNGFIPKLCSYSHTRNYKIFQATSAFVQSILYVCRITLYVEAPMSICLICLCGKGPSWIFWETWKRTWRPDSHGTKGFWRPFLLIFHSIDGLSRIFSSGPSAKKHVAFASSKTLKGCKKN